MKYEEALDLLSPDACASVNIDDDSEEETLEGADAHKGLMDIMKYSTHELGEMLELSQAVEAFPPWDPKVLILEQPFSKEFTIARLDPAEIGEYICKPTHFSAGEYYIVLFRFRQGGGVLGFLWGKEENQWRISAYRIFEQ
jgi:hypothetical protein